MLKRLAIQRNERVSKTRMPGKWEAGNIGQKQKREGWNLR